jgi:Holliday junction resolvase
VYLYPQPRSKLVAATPEKRVKDKVVGILKAEGAYYFFPATHGYGRSGVPDIVACVNGHFLAIECKAGKNKPTALQVREIENIRLANGVAVVANEENWELVRDVIRKLKGGV